MTIVTGAIKFTDVPNDFCITDITALVQFVQKHGIVEFNASEITNVVVSNEQPTDTSVVWFQISPSGNYIGVCLCKVSGYLYSLPWPGD